MQSRLILLLSAAGAALAQTLSDILAAQSLTLSTLNAWLATQPLVYQILSSAQGVTMLAPSNDALNQLYNSPLVNQLAADPNFLTAFLSYHVLDGVYSIADLQSNATGFAPTFMNMAAYSNVTGGQVVRSQSQNDAVKLFSGSNSQANVQPYDYDYSGGTVHIIDSALAIPSALSDTLIAEGLTAAVGALRRADAEDPLNRTADLTVFAPTNDAFNVIGSLIENMTPEQLSTVLNYHVVRGTVLYSPQMRRNGSLATPAGGSLNFRALNGRLYVNSARVVMSDLLLGNGVMHILDGVLNPANASATPDPNAATQPPAFDGASSTDGGVPFTSAVATSTGTASPMPQPTSITPPASGDCACESASTVAVAAVVAGIISVLLGF